MNHKLNIRETIIITEPRREVVARERLAFLDESQLDQVRQALLPLVTITSDLKGSNFIFEPGTRSGAIEVLGLRVEVRPRLSVEEFITMIQYTWSGRVSAINLRLSSRLTQDYGFEDALCLLLADETDRILRLGLSRCYHERTEPLDVLRGRIVWDKNFPWRGARARELTCRFHRLTYDNVDNQILHAGLSRAAALVNEEKIRDSILQHLNTFSELASLVRCEPKHFERALHGYNRLNEHYRCAHAVCRMFLFGLRPPSLFDPGVEVFSGISLDMADLFEQFLLRLMKDILGPSGFTFWYQAPDYNALLDSEHEHYASVRPDIEIRHLNKLCGVMDAKYKDYWEADEKFGKPVRKVSNEDLYQLFFYQQRLMRKHQLQTLPVAIIASPLPESDERNDRPEVPERFRRITWQAGSEVGGNVNLILIPITGFLRFLRKGELPMIAINKLGINGIRNLFASTN